MPDEVQRSYRMANVWWAATAVWAFLYLIAGTFDRETIAESYKAGEWLNLLDTFSIGAIGVVSVAALAIEYRTRQKATRESDDAEG